MAEIHDTAVERGCLAEEELLGGPRRRPGIVAADENHPTVPAASSTRRATTRREKTRFLCQKELPTIRTYGRAREAGQSFPRRRGLRGGRLQRDDGARSRSTTPSLAASMAAWSEKNPTSSALESAAAVATR